MTQFTTGTSGATGGLQQTTRWNASLKVRLAGFAVAVIAVAFLIIRIDTSIWRQQAQLQEEFAAVKAEKFYFAANFRVSLRQIREAWLELISHGKPGRPRRLPARGTRAPGVAAKQGRELPDSERTGEVSAIGSGLRRLYGPPEPPDGEEWSAAKAAKVLPQRTRNCGLNPSPCWTCARRW